MPCCFPTCNSVTYAYIDDEKNVTPLPRILNVEDYLDYISNRVMPDLGAEIRRALEGLWSSSAVLGSEKVAKEFSFSCSACGLPDGGLDVKGLVELHVHDHAARFHGPLDVQSEEPHEVLQGISAAWRQADSVLCVQHGWLSRAGAASSSWEWSEAGWRRGAPVSRTKFSLSSFRSSATERAAIRWWNLTGTANEPEPRRRRQSPAARRCMKATSPACCLGDSFHPGGMRLTRAPGREARTCAPAAGARRCQRQRRERDFPCPRLRLRGRRRRLRRENVRKPQSAGRQANVAHLVSFRQGDAEKLDFPRRKLRRGHLRVRLLHFPDKRAAASEFARVLKPGGRIGLSDLTRAAGCRRVDGSAGLGRLHRRRSACRGIRGYLETAGMHEVEIESHDEALAEMVRDIQGKLLGAELMRKLKKLDLAGVDFAQAKSLARAAAEAVRARTLGYAILIGIKDAALSN